MWNSINKIIKPLSLSAAWQNREPQSSFFGGGSYLLAEKSEKIKTLIDLQGLLKSEISVKDHHIRMGAAIELQVIVDKLSRKQPDSAFIKAVKNSCPSINIRNQRSLGGEIGQNRAGSDILVYLHAVNAELKIFKEKEFSVLLREWDGKGIITEINFPTDFKSIEYQRYALIPSAPAIVIITGVRNGDNFDFAVGGNADFIQNFTISKTDWNKNNILNLAQKAGENFKKDHFASIEYKILLLETAFKRTEAEL